VGAGAIIGLGCCTIDAVLGWIDESVAYGLYDLIGIEVALIDDTVDGN
jgi:hypothetical protein